MAWGRGAIGGSCTANVYVDAHVHDPAGYERATAARHRARASARAPASNRQ
jgi:hypothetical protein